MVGREKAGEAVQEGQAGDVEGVGCVEDVGSVVVARWVLVKGWVQWGGGGRGGPKVDVRLSTGQKPAQDADGPSMLLGGVGVRRFAVTKRL